MEQVEAVGGLTHGDDDICGVEDDAVRQGLAEVACPRQEDHQGRVHGQTLQVAGQGLPTHPLLGWNGLGAVVPQGTHGMPMVGHLQGLGFRAVQLPIPLGGEFQIC